MAQQRHKIVMNTLLRQIFQNKLKAGDKLPTERELSKDMDVDRTSLRIALKQLESMQVLEIKQGDGIYVRDYMKNAGVDFLRLLFLQEEDDENEVVIDEYILDEVWEYWIEFMPLMLRMAMKRITTRDIKSLLDCLGEELACMEDKEKVIELEVQQQEMIAERTNNLLFLLISNSTRPLRKKMVTLFINSISDEVLKEHIELKIALNRSYLAGNLKNPDSLVSEYKKVLASHREMTRGAWGLSSKDMKIAKNFLESGKSNKG